jgi:Lar family restriction alleviation protein
MKKLGYCPHPIDTCTPIKWVRDKDGEPNWGFICEVCLAAVSPYSPNVDIGFKRTPALKPCPFCASESVYFSKIYDARGELVEDAFQIGCSDCQITFACGDSTKEDIAELWNSRA